MGSFTPLVFGTNDGMGNGCQPFLKYLADKIVQKDTELYNTVIAWLRTQISFEQLRSVHACVRGSRTPLQRKILSLLKLASKSRATTANSECRSLLHTFLVSCTFAFFDLLRSSAAKLAHLRLRYLIHLYLTLCLVQ